MRFGTSFYNFLSRFTDLSYRTPIESEGQSTEISPPSSMEHFSLSGEFWVCLTIHAKRAFKNRSQFKEAKGTEEFYETILRLGKDWGTAPDLSFEINSSSKSLRRDGSVAGVFNQHPLDYEFVPIFDYRPKESLLDVQETDRMTIRDNKLEKYADTCTESLRKALEITQQNHAFCAMNIIDSKRWKKLLKQQGSSMEALLKAYRELHCSALRDFADEWTSWKKHLILSRYGYFQVWLKKPFTSHRVSEVLDLGHSLDRLYFGESDFKKITNGMELADNLSKLSIDPYTPECYYQWEMARILISMFIDDCQRQFGGIGKFDLASKFDQLWYTDCDNTHRRETAGPDLPLRWRHVAFFLKKVSCDGVEIRSIDEPTERVMATLVEGVPIRFGAKKDWSGEAPNLASDAVSDWSRRNVASWENEVMLTSCDITLIYSPLSEKITCRFSQEIPYYNYWLTILRGIALLCEMRTLSIQLRAETSRLLEKTISEETATPRLVQENRKLSSLLARLRTASDASTIASADYAVGKFRQISREFSIDEIIESTQKNLELSNADLAQKESMALDRSQAKLNLGLSLFAGLTIMIELPSFWEATGNLYRKHQAWLPKELALFDRPQQVSFFLELADHIGGIAITLCIILFVIFITRLLTSTLSAIPGRFIRGYRSARSFAGRIVWRVRKRSGTG